MQSHYIVSRGPDRICGTCGAIFSMYGRPKTSAFCTWACYVARPRPGLAEMFWRRVDQSDPNGCWLWTGAIAYGYGKLRFEKKSYIASRVSYILTNGSIPYGIHVLHHCDNPPCVRPDHLFLGNDADNHADQLAKSRQRKGSTMHNARLNENLVLNLRQRWRDGERCSDLAKELGLHYVTVEKAVKSKTWRHV